MTRALMTNAAAPIALPEAATLRRPGELVDACLVAPEERAAIEAVAARYAVAITPAIAGLIDGGDPDDPLARQFVPDPRELIHTPQEHGDPIGDHAHSPVDGIVHRYPDRVLLKPVHVCPVYCRFCFRREMVGPGKESALGPDALDAAIAYIATRPEIWEVVITGGDPLIMAPRRISALVRRLAAIDHVKVLRWHTRVPVVAPERVTPALIEAMRVPGKAVYVVLHANHPRELTEAARAACARLVDGGIVMLSQSVLLHGINDDAATLGALMRAFVENRIKPYYLHHGDLAPGTGHFRTTIAEGQALMRALRGHYSGLCQPTYVLDIPGGHGKAVIGPCEAVAREGKAPEGETRENDTGESDTRKNDTREGEAWDVTDFRGGTHRYPPG